MANRKPAGRKSKYGEPLSEKVQVLLTSTQSQKVEERFKNDPDFEAQEVGDYIRELFLRHLGILPPDPRDVKENPFIGEPSHDIPILGVTYGGPGEEVVKTQIATIAVTQSMGRMLGYQEGDQFLQVTGDSMAGAGVVDGSYVLMYDLNGMRPSRGYIALVQIVSENDEYTSTLKRYMGTDNRGLPKLENAEGEAFEYPDGTKSAEAIMVARAAITKL